MFQTVIAADRAKHREMGAYGPQSFVTIHRDTLMQVGNSLHAFSDSRKAFCHIINAPILPECNCFLPLGEDPIPSQKSPT